MTVQPPLIGDLVDLDDARRAFLSAEERATAGLIGFYREARMEVTRLLETTPVLTLSEASYYGAIRTQLDTVLVQMDAAGSDYIRRTLEVAYREGLVTHLGPSRVNLLGESVQLPLINQRALQALSQDSLGLITRVTEDVRLAVRQQIGQGIASGLTGPELRRRLGQTGLTRGPWRNLETRAGVIARTETMRAYNGGALAGIVDTGAMAVRWIASRDEAACPICGPRNGRDYKLRRVSESRWVDALPAFPGIPAHPRCRCTIRAQYREPDGRLIGEVRYPTPDPTPGPVAIAQVGARGPTASGDLDSVITALKSPDPLDSGITERMVSMDLDAASIGRLAKELSARDMSVLWDARYGVRLDWPSVKTNHAFWTGPKGEAGRAQMLSAMEKVRAIAPRYVQTAMDPAARVASSGLRFSPYLRSIELGKTVKKNWVAQASPTGEVIIDAAKAKPYIGRGLRADREEGIEEVLIHEIGHTVHNRFGWGGVTGANRGAAVELLDDAEWRRMIHEWEALRHASRVAHLSPVEVTTFRRNLEMANLNLEKIAQAEASYPAGHPTRLYYARQRRAQERFQRDAQTALEGMAEAADPAVEAFPTTYAMESQKEDFAEAFMLYLVDPAALRTAAPGRYDWMRRWIFGGEEVAP